MIIAQHTKFLSFILLLLVAGLACNFPGLDQNQSDLDGIAPITTDDAPPPPPGNSPDLVVDSITIEKTTIVLEAEPKTYVTFQVTNIGTAPTPDVVLAAMNLIDQGFYQYYDLDGPLQPGESATHQFAVGDQDIWPIGSHSLEIVADFWDEIPESNEDNNKSNPISFEIVAP